MRLSFGQSGEKQAEKFLVKSGYSILERNFRCRFGEIDIIAFKDGVTVFVEVKTRKNSSFGMGYESVTQKKMEKLVLTAQAYFASKTETASRFDVISIDGGEVTHIINAFGA